MNPLDSVTSLVDSVGSNIDKNFESGEERQQQLSSRHTADMASDSWLSKNIRPITLIFLMVCQLTIILGMLYGATIDPWIIGQVGTLLFGAFGFYFNSKKGESMMAKKVEGAMKIEEMRAKAQVDRDKLVYNEERKKLRKEARAARKSARKSEAL